MNNNNPNLWIVPRNNENRIVEYRPRERILQLRNRDVRIVPQPQVAPAQEASQAKKWLVTALKIACAIVIVGLLITAAALSFIAAPAAPAAALTYLLYTNGAISVISAKAMILLALDNNMFQHTNNNRRDVRNFYVNGMNRIARIGRHIFSERFNDIVRGNDPHARQNHYRRVLNELHNAIRYDVVRA